MRTEAVRMEVPQGCNIVVGQAHFIKTVEDLFEAIASSVPGARFAVAFCEASGPRLIRCEANDEELRQAAVECARRIGAGHVFVILLRDAFPINVLNAIRLCPEVCRIFCATANPLEVVVAETEQGRGVLGVVDGFSPQGVEGSEDRAARLELLRKFGYKCSPR